MKKISLTLLTITLFISCSESNKETKKTEESNIEIIQERNHSTLFEAKITDFNLDELEEGGAQSLALTIDKVTLSGKASDLHLGATDLFIANVNEHGIQFESNEKTELANKGSEYKLISRGVIVIGTETYSSSYVNFLNKGNEQIRGMLYIDPKPENLKFDGPLVIEFKGKKK